MVEPTEDALIRGTHSTRDAAKDVAGKLMQGMESAKPDAEPKDTLPAGTKPAGDDEPITAQPGEGVKPEAGAELEPTGDEDIESFEVDAALLDSLSEMGIELGVDPESVPAELKPAYNSLVRAAMNVVEELVDTNVEAQNLRLQQQELSDQIKRDPTKFLLALMVTYPGEFKEVIDVYTAAQEDENIVPRVYRELETEAKLREADRREKLLDHREKVVLARRLTSATRRSAKRYGVDATQAERLVATHIKANGNKLEVGQVDGIVKQLSGGKRTPLRKQVITPDKSKAAATAPGEAPGGEPAGPGAGERKRSSRVRSPIGNLVRDAFKRAMTE